MRWVGITAMALAAATSVCALPGGAGEGQQPPLSVWRVEAAGAEHLQSGLACPAQFRTYRRINLHVYDRFGLDVSCNYLDPAVSDVTVYLTRRSGSMPADAMTEAKREFLQVRAAMHPRPISETQPALGGLAWQLTLYDVDGGMRDAIWIADLDGWTLEYRVTYRANGEDRVMADMAAFVDAARGSAGTRLDLCGKSPPPARNGVLSHAHKDPQADAMMAAIVGAAAQSAVEKADPAKRATTSIAWCAEQPISGGPHDLMLWRGVLPDGADAKADRVTAMTVEAPPELVAADNSELDLVRGELNQSSEWEATIEQGGQTSIWGYFTARPRPEALAEVYQNILSGKARPLSSYSKHGNQITIGVAPAK
jgi:hypothetical protein